MMGMVAVAMMLGGCAETDNDVMETAPAVKDGQTVKIKVVDNGYGDVTRAAESNEEEAQGENTIMQTNFIAGDKIGVFSISAGGAQHYRNLELRYDGTNWVNPDGESFYYFTGMRYFAYYPYNPDFDMSKVDWSQTTVDEFFAPYVAAWQPQADQSTTKQYMASDLMVGAGAMSGETFTFSMGHAMGLIFVSVDEVLKGTVFHFPKLTEADAIDSLTADSKLFSFEQKVYKPSRKQGYYRYIVKPGKAQFISGMNPDGRLFSFTCENVSSGHYKKFVVDGGFDATKSELKDVTVEVGDVFLSDGTFVKRPVGSTVTATYGSATNNKVLGVVVYLAEMGDEYIEGYTHGLVLKSTWTYKTVWAYDQYAQSKDIEGIPNCTTFPEAALDKSGLSNCYALGYNSYSSRYYWADQSQALQGKVSPWFVPSSGQWVKIATGLGAVVDMNNSSSSNAFTYPNGETTNFSTDIKAIYSCISKTLNTDYGYISSTESNALGTMIWKFVISTKPSMSTHTKSSQYISIIQACAF